MSPIAMPMASRQHTDRASDRDQSVIGWGAAIIDEQGNETPITESMIERACNELAGHWLFPRQGNLAG